MRQHLSLPPDWQHTHLPSTESTMNCLDGLPLPDEPPRTIHLVTTDYQRHGHGQRGNSWESEYGANLLFSFAFRPENVAANRQFHISEALALSIVTELHSFSPVFCIKWPNDIYWRSKKIGGMLLEHTVEGGKIVRTLVGVGLNVNQRIFKSDAPNPVSLRQITGKRHEPALLMQRIASAFSNWQALLTQQRFDEIHKAYMSSLYREKGLHPYADADGCRFEAEIAGISPLGILTLRTATGEVRQFAFKEISFLPDEP